MVRIVVALSALASLVPACVLDTSGTGNLPPASASPDPVTTSSSSVGSGSSGSGSSGSGGSGGGAPLPAAFCDADDPSLVACYRFDRTTADGSQYHHDPSVAENVSYGAGVVGEALRLQPDSHVRIPSAQGWDITTATLELWVQPAALPAGTLGETSPRVGLLDRDGHFGLFIYPGGQLGCTLGERLLAGSVAAGAWTHVACTSDGAEVRLYVDGTLAGSLATQPLAPTSSEIALGSNAPDGDRFEGLIDDLRIWSAPRTPAQICADAGQNCQEPP